MKAAQNKMAADAKQMLPRVLKAITSTGRDGQQFVGGLHPPVHSISPFEVKHSNE